MQVYLVVLIAQLKIHGCENSVVVWFDMICTLYPASCVLETQIFRIPYNLQLYPSIQLHPILFNFGHPIVANSMSQTLPTHSNSFHGIWHANSKSPCLGPWSMFGNFTMETNVTGSFIYSYGCFHKWWYPKWMVYTEKNLLVPLQETSICRWSFHSPSIHRVPWSSYDEYPVVFTIKTWLQARIMAETDNELMVPTPGGKITHITWSWQIWWALFQVVKVRHG